MKRTTYENEFDEHSIQSRLACKECFCDRDSEWKQYKPLLPISLQIFLYLYIS